MSSVKSHGQSSSPQFPSIEQVSGDIFFQVKKEILDKLDIILQKVNLQVIEYLKPQTERKDEKKNFRFIQLSSFQKQIQTLFDYLDRLYESLNSSISFSSVDIKNSLSQSNQVKNQSLNQFNSVLVNQINQMKLKFQQLGEQTIRLREENQHMKFLIKTNLSNTVSLSHSVNQESKSSLRNVRSDSKTKQSVKSNGSKEPFNTTDYNQQQTTQSPHTEGISLETVKKILRFYNHSIRQLSIEYKQSMKEIKKILKNARFQMIESRVECIGELKKWMEKRQALSEPSTQRMMKQKSINKNSPTFYAKNDSLQESKKESIKDPCTQQCYKQYYEQMEQRNGFEQSLLDKIQQILDVC